MNKADLDAFARLLDGDLPEGEATAEARLLSGFARALEASATVPRMESKADLRLALVEAAREQAAAPPFLTSLRQKFDDSTARWRYSMRTAAASGAAAMALSSGGVALAAHRSAPDDAFYGVKLAFEDLRLALIADPVARAQQLFAYANQRLLEAEIAAEDGDMAAARRALLEADQSSRDAAGYIIRASQERGDPSLLTLLDEFTEMHRKRLAALLPLLTGDAAAAGEDAMVGLRRISQRVAVLNRPCAECGAQPGTSPAGGDRGRGADADVAPDPDFDFADIPPASEPFAACPCTPGDTTTVNTGAGKGKGTDAGATGGGDNQADPPPATGDKPAAGGDDPEDPAEPGNRPGDSPGDEGPLPDPVDDSVKEAEDVIDDLLENPPTELPDDLPDLPVSPPPLPLPTGPSVDDLLP